MKTIRLYFYLCLICCFNSTYAQEEVMGNGLIFPQFEKGTVVFKNGTNSNAMLNYDMTMQEMLFKDANNNVMAISNPSEILVVIIDGRRFLPASKSGFYEEIQAGTEYFYVQRRAYLLSEGKAAAYGGYSQTTSISSYGVYSSESTGQTIQLNPDEKFKLKTECLYYLQSGKNYKMFSSAKSLGKLFKGQGSKIEAFAKEQSINFSNIDDIARIVEYGYSLMSGK